MHTYGLKTYQIRGISTCFLGSEIHCPPPIDSFVVVTHLSRRKQLGQPVLTGAVLK